MLIITVGLCMGGLCVRPLEILLISRWVNAGKFCYCMNLLSYLLPVKWRKYQYTKLISEFLTIFLLCLPYRKCCVNVDLTLQRQRLTCATLTNGPSGRLMSARGQQSTTRVSLCSRDKHTQITKLSRQWTLFCVVQLLYFICWANIA